ncbi:MAG: hypothetical protein IJC25_00675, partial [Clostridia bacterium]|nr:hypothetical protein [Clostridia bacterium]
ITEYGVGHERRIEKLNRIVHKCRRYGIKVYVFAIEPAGLTDELAPKYPDMVGQRNGGIFSWTMCPHSERTRAYCYEAGFRLFTLCPGLGGFISITSGERTTSCALPCDITCPRCAALPRGEVLAQNVENLFAGIKAAKPTAECVSWTYDHRIWNDRDIVDYVKNAPESALLMQNFEDRGFPEQLGKERQAMDYWLSYTGPSEMFVTAAEATRKHGRQLWAKMQICCSHELATVPYVPSPAHVFEKIRSARRLGVTGIMECWYFGNYPCFMSKAVGDLAFCDDISDETAYLHRLASACFGHTDAPAVVSAWQHFKRGYRQYPVNIMFSYYSPAHDGVVWELALKPKNFSPSRSWLLLDKPDGDRMCDCLLTGHTLDEAITLFSRMKRHYSRALKALSPVCGKGSAAADELGIVSSAVDVLCKSCCNILRFYRLRDELGTGEGDPYKVLAKMRRLVLDEIRQSTAMIALCQKDARLGYHSEAEGYKFFPEKLQHRINTLRTLLATEFAEVKKRIDNGLSPLEYYLGVEEDCRHCYIIKESSPDRALHEPLSDERYAFRMAADKENLFIQLHAPRETVFTVQPEFRLFEV